MPPMRDDDTCRKRAGQKISPATRRKGVGVSKVGGKSVRLWGSPDASANSSARPVMDIDLTAEQEAEARRTFDRLRRAGNATAETAFQNIDRPLAVAVSVHFGIDRRRKPLRSATFTTPRLQD